MWSRAFACVTLLVSAQVTAQQSPPEASPLVFVKQVQPVYPSIAQGARVQGIVIVQASAGPDGRVTSALR